METLRLKPTWHHCPANHIPLIFNGSYHCLPLPSGNGINGVTGLSGGSGLGWGLVLGVMAAGVALAFALR